MKTKLFISMVLSSVMLCSMTAVSAFAQERRPQIDVVSPMYEIAKSPSSTLHFDGNDATCTSSVSGTNTVSITAEQTLEKYSGWFWIWNSVEGANWTKTVPDNNIRISNTKSNLGNGTYRLKTVFTLTDKNGKTETITVYSNEKTVG